MNSYRHQPSIQASYEWAMAVGVLCRAGCRSAAEAKCRLSTANHIGSWCHNTAFCI